MRAYFTRAGDAFEAGELTRGPWHPGLQHAGPAAALLGRAIESHPDFAGFQVARLTYELLRPLPVGARFHVRCEPGRPGRKVRGLEAALLEGERAVVRCHALLMREADVPLPPLPGPAALPPAADAEPWAFPFFTSDVGYHRSMELRRARGSFGSGRMAVWFRLTCAVVEGEEPTPLQRLLAAADSGNGVSVALDLARFTFVNADLTVALLRRPRGEWFALDARTLAASEGQGLAEARLWDESGVVGRSVQTLLIEPRG